MTYIDKNIPMNFKEFTEKYFAENIFHSNSLAIIETVSKAIEENKMSILVGSNAYGHVQYINYSKSIFETVRALLQGKTVMFVSYYKSSDYNIFRQIRSIRKILGEDSLIVEDNGKQKTVTIRRAVAIIMDDPIESQSQYSDEEREQVIKKWMDDPIFNREEREKAIRENGRIISEKLNKFLNEGNSDSKD